MPVFKRTLPGGRGYRAGQDSAVNQGESWGIRRDQIPDQGGLFVGTSPNPCTASTSPLAQVAKRASFVLLPDRTLITNIAQARCQLDAAVAGSTMSVALYQRVSANRPQLRQIPASLVSFSTATVGALNNTLATVSTIMPGVGLFLGWLPTAAVIIQGHDKTNGLPIFYRDGQTALPQTVDLTALNKSYATSPIAMTYLSLSAANLL